MCVRHLPRWNIGHILNIGNILKIGHGQVGVLRLLLNILLIWPVLIFISCFIYSHQPSFSLGEPRTNPAKHFKGASYSSLPPTPFFSWALRLVPAGINHYNSCIWIVDCDPGSAYGSSLVLSGWMGHKNYTWLSRHWLNLPPNIPAAIYLFFCCITTQV